MKNKTLLDSELSRRGFVKASATTATAAALTSGLTLPFSSVTKAAEASTSGGEEKIKWSACLVNCGSRCPLKVHVKDDQIVRIDTEDGIDDSVFGQHQIRPCLRGRSNRYKTYNPDRFKYPMKRIGKRGEGKFKRISWDEATTIIADKLRHTIDTYGNEAIYYQYGSGSTGANLHGRSACKRLLNLLGGYLEQHNTYSTAQIGRVEPFVYGKPQGSYMAQIKHSDLVVMFCQNIAETRMSGGGQVQELYRALEQSQAKVIIIDPRRTDSVVGLNAEWLPIRPGTDAALVAAIGHTLIKEDMADDEFINKYAVGWDESTLPASAEKNASYKSYILGLGTDKTEKTPEWAAAITGIPAKRIRQLARELFNAKAAWISQGWGLQRSMNGEQASRAVMMLPVITKQFGRQGTNSGNWGYSSNYPVAGLAIPNPVKTSIPCFLWTKAIADHENMTAKNSYVKGKERLETGVKFLWSYSSGVTMNQHSDLNHTHEILSDESKCEFILVWDHHMTSSARYADILLPDVSWLEAADLVNNSYATGPYHYLIRMQPTITPLWENRPNYDVLADIAHKLGIGEKFTEGRTLDQWIEHSYNKIREKRPYLPEFSATNDMGIIDRELADIESHIALKEFREDPEANKLPTPSGKIEIYSEQLATLDKEWELPEGDRIPAVAEYLPTREGLGDVERMKQFPLQMTGFHTKRRTHSTYHSVAILREAVPDEVWMNPMDASQRGLKHGDMTIIFNDRGQVQMPVKVTERIMPGVVAVPQGAWYQPNRNGVDIGGCINSLTTQHPSPLAKGNPQHSNLVEIKRA